jgi:pimeloyl-ACP methyl ester carboxylesterase
VDVILIGGLWLDASIWTPVVEELELRGWRGLPVALPGQGDGNASATLDDQLAAVLTQVEAADTPYLVGHSAAASLAWLAVDAQPDAVSGVAFLGGFPNPDGERYADLFEHVDGRMEFPGWAEFEGPDSADLDEAARDSIARDMVAVPEGVSRATVRLHDERRYSVPITVICPEFSPEEAQEAIDEGDAPELAAAAHVRLIDLASGHWPMVTQPAALAEAIIDAASAE